MKFDPIEYYPQVKAYVEELRAEGRSEGRQQEALRLVLRILGRRVGLPGPEVQARLEALSTEQLEDLGEALLDFTRPEDLTAWLAKRPKARKGRRKQD
jgi:predicted transposase YdaD